MTSYINAEKLIILNDIAHGLLNRVYYLIDFKYDEIFNSPDIDKYIKDVVKKFPHFSDSSKGPRYDAFYKRSAEIQSATRNYYTTFLDVLNFTEEAWKVISGMATVTFSWKSNSDLMSMYYTLFTNYVKVHMLVGRIENSKYYLTAFARAHQCCHGNNEPNLEKVGTYLTDFAKPLDRIRMDCFEFGDDIVVELLPFASTVSSSSDAKTFMAKKRFHIIDDQRNMHRPTDELVYSKLMNVNNFREWITFVFLVCPGGMHRQEARDLLCTIIRGDFVVSIWRNITFQPIVEFLNMFENFKFNKVSLKKHSKVIKDASKDMEQTLQSHLNMRTYLRVTCNTLLEFFSEFAGAIGPKILMILAAVRLGRDEVGWYFRHRFANIGKKKVNFVADPFVAELIFYVHSITDLLRTHQKQISNYYLEYLALGVGDKDASLIAQTFLSESKGQQNIMYEVQPLIETITTGLANANDKTSMEHIRLNWYRVSCSTSNEFSGFQPSSVATFGISFTKIIAHTRMVDGLSAQIKTHCSFSELYWYPEGLEESFLSCLRSTGTARNCMSFVRLLNNAMHNIHLRLCPEEQKSIGLNIGAMAKRWLKSIVEHIEKLVEHVSTSTYNFRMQCSTREVIKSIRDGVITTPGDESLIANGKSINKTRLMKKAISELCASIHQYDYLTVYNIELIPREYLIDQITSHFRTYLRSIIKGAYAGEGEVRVDSDMPYYLAPPTEILDRMGDFVLAYQNVEYYINVDVSEIIRYVLLSEFSIKKLANHMGEPIEVLNMLKLDEMEREEQPIIHYIANWYRLLFSSKFFISNATYSKLDKCFTYNKHSSRSFNLAQYTDVPNLVALCQLIGPSGLRVLDSYLMMTVTSKMETIKTSLTTYKTTLDGLTNQFSHRDVWKQGCTDLSELDFVIGASVTLGTVLQFRRNLNEANGTVTRHAIPFAQKSVQLAYNHIRTKQFEIDNSHMVLDSIAVDTGCNINFGDSVLRRALKKYCAHQSDYELFNHLPELYGMAFTSKIWRNASYQIGAKGHNNNVHCLAICISSLIIATKCTADIQPSRSNYTVHGDITESMQRFLKNASYSLLHLNAESKGNIAHMMVFLEQFVMMSRGRIEMAYLEECFPFAFIRQNFIHLYETQTDLKTRVTTTEVEEKKES